MCEFELPSMEKMAFEVVPFSIERIAGDRMSEMLEVDPDLVGATCARHASHQGPSVTDGQQFVIGHGIPAGGGAARGHLLALHGVTSYSQINGSLRVSGPSPDDGEIGFFHLSVRKLRRKSGVGLIVLCNDNAAAGFLVEAMNDSGAVLFGTGGEGASVVQESIHKGTLLMARANVNDHPGRFVDHQQIGVLMKDLEGDILRSGSRGWFGSLLLDQEEVAGLHLIAAADRFPTQGDAARFY
jgi:hypothetical protein